MRAGFRAELARQEASFGQVIGKQQAQLEVRASPVGVLICLNDLHVGKAEHLVTDSEFPSSSVQRLATLTEHQ